MRVNGYTDAVPAEPTSDNNIFTNEILPKVLIQSTIRQKSCGFLVRRPCCMYFSCSFVST
jgi:hypothetical protein